MVSAFEMDSVVFRDGLPPLTMKEDLYAGGELEGFHSLSERNGEGLHQLHQLLYSINSTRSESPSKPDSGHRVMGEADGRFIFALGNRRVSDPSAEIALDNEQGLTDDHYVSFEMDAFDLFLAKRARFVIYDLYSNGTIQGFDALDQNTVVITDYNESDEVLRQRLVKIDWNKKTAECPIYRTYAIVLDDPVRTAVGEEQLVTVSGDKAFIFPCNPLKATPHREFTELKDKAVDYAKNFYRRGTVNPDDISVNIPPFFISSTVIFFFVFNDDVVDLGTALVLDLTNDRFYLQDIESSSSFPCPNSRQRNAIFHQGNDREVLISVLYDDSDNWVRARLNTRTMQRTDLNVNIESPEFVVFKHGLHLVVASKTREVGASRVIGGEKEQEEVEREGRAMLRLDVLRHPLRVNSLVRLATIAVQRSGRVPSLQLLQIADRIG